MTFAHDDWAENWTYDAGYIQGQGSAHSVSGDGPDFDAVSELHKVVEEVTGKPVQKPARRIGFF